MKNPARLQVSTALFALSAFFIIFFHSVPETQLWKGWKLLYVRSEKLTEQNICTILEKNGCTDVVSSVNQKLPVFSKFAPVQVQPADSYIYRRSGFFRDSTSSYSVFYVPEKNADALKLSVDEINGYPQTSAACEGGTSFPWICPVLVFAFFFVLLFLSREKLKFSLVSCLLLIFSVARPFYSAGGAVILCLLSNFFLLKVYRRKGVYSDFKNAVYTVLPPVLCFFLLGFSSLPGSVLFALAFTGGWLAPGIVEGVIDLYSKKDPQFQFDFVYIKSSSAVKPVNRTNFFLLGVVFVLVAVLFLCHAVFSTGTPLEFSGERPLLPAPVSSVLAAADELPDLKDFADWSWFTVSFPFRKLGAVPSKNGDLFGETVSVPEYFLTAENSSGKERISVKQDKVLSYDSSFVRSVYDRIEDAEYPALEKVLLVQGKNKSYGYTKSAGTSSEKSVPLVLSFFALFPILLFLYYVVGNLKDEASL